MLRKLRLRFIGSAVAAFAVVIVLLFAVINTANALSVTAQLDRTSEMLLTEPSDKNPPPELPGKAEAPAGEDMRGGFSPEVRFMLRYFSVQCDENGEVVSVHLDADFIASITEDTAREYTSLALAKGGDTGFVAAYRYRIALENGGCRILFLNAEREKETIRSLLWLTGGIAAASIAVLTLLIFALSDRAIRPYLRNLDAQKQFITNASHELKTPLAAISTSADVLDAELPDNEWVTAIRTEVRKMGRRIADLITLSRLEEENPFPQRVRFSVSDAVWEASEPFTARCDARGIPFAREIDDNLFANGDSGALMQVCTVLLDNAVRYTLPVPDGRIRLTATARGKKTRITLENTCELPPDADVTKLFNRFYKGDKAHTAQTGSGGIGLSIAKATMDALGGNISVTHQKGTPETIRFTIQL